MAYETTTKLKGQDSLAIVADQLIFHSLANGWAFWGGVGWLLRPSNPLESSWAVARDGTRVQLVPENVIAEANYRANRRLYKGEYRGAISVETDSDVPAIEPWTDAQMDSLAGLGAEILVRNPKIAPRICPAWNEPGIGYHTMWGAPSNWTPVAKSCPGPARIKQFPELAQEIIHRVTTGSASKKTEPIKAYLLEDDMANTLLTTDPRFGITWVIQDDLSSKVPILQTEVDAYIKAKVVNGGKAQWCSLSPQTLDRIPDAGAYDLVGDGKGSH